MADERSEYHRDLWLPVLVGLVGALVSLAGWGLIVAERRDQILSSAEGMAEETHDALYTGLKKQMESLRGLHELWASFGLRPPEEWKANVGQRVDQVPGLISVAWIDLADPREDVWVGAGPTEGAVLDETSRWNYSGDASLEGPDRDTSGEFGYRVLLPVETPTGRSGVMVARFNVEPLLESVLQARARGYALSVDWGGQTIYARGTASTGSWQNWWHVEQAVELPFGGQWTLDYRPTPELAAARLTPLPQYLLAAALLLSTALAVLAHQMRVVTRQARFLAASNRALESRKADLESRVSARTADLEDAVAELEMFNHSVSHDLRSPLSAILNFAAILEEDYRERALDAEGLAILSRIQGSAKRATNLLEDLLQLSRTGRSPLTFEAVEMGALAKGCFAQVLSAQGEADVEFVVDPLPNAFADRALIADVFVNLFTNAVKYSRNCEKPRITVRGAVEDDQNVYEVIDNGQGFDMRFVDKIFGLFERLHSDQEIEGTGVGLAIVARIIKRHGGRVSADGRLGEGATISFSLPIRSQHE